MARAKGPKKLTKAQEKALDRLRDDVVILSLKEGEAEPTYTLASGRRVHATVIRNLIRAGLLVGAGDALLGEISQTYRVGAVPMQAAA